MDRTCLFVCHDFPPAAGSGSNRAVALARYLPEYGWRPVVLTPRLLEELTNVIPWITVSSGGFLNVFQLQTIVFGILIILFITLEPRGLFGLWVRVRNYFKAWPFSY